MSIFRNQRIYREGDEVVLFTPNPRVGKSLRKNKFDLRAVSQEYRYPIKSVKILHRFDILTITGNGERFIYRSLNPLKKGTLQSKETVRNSSLSFEIKKIEISSDIKNLIEE